MTLLLTSVEVGDLFRFVTLSLGGLYAAALIAFSVRYLAIWVGFRRRGETWPGVQPRHILAVMASFMVVLTLSLTGVIASIHEPLDWRNPVRIFAYSLGIYGLSRMKTSPAIETALTDVERGG